MKMSRVVRARFARVYTFFSFVIASQLGIADARAEFIEDIQRRMSESGKLIFGNATQYFQETGYQVFTQENGFRSHVLHSFCSEVYGEPSDSQSKLGPAAPLILRSGSARVGQGGKSPPQGDGRSSGFSWEALNASFAQNCSNHTFIEGLLNAYWTVTGVQLESFLMRFAKLVNLYQGQEEHLIYGDQETPTPTMNMEAAVINHADPNTFTAAILADTAAIQRKVFGNLRNIYLRAKTQIQLSKKYREKFPNQEDLIAAEADLFAEFEKVGQFN